MRAELFECAGGCGLIHAILVDRREAAPVCAACGKPVRALGAADAATFAHKVLEDALARGAAEKDLERSVHRLVDASGLVRYLDHAASWDQTRARELAVEPGER